MYSKAIPTIPLQANDLLDLMNLVLLIVIEANQGLSSLSFSFPFLPVTTSLSLYPVL